MSLAKNWKVPKRKQPIWKIVRPFLKGKYKVDIEFLGEKFPEKCIIISNHANKRGPMVYEISLPVFHATWGAYQMLGSYKDRFKYLRNVLYIQKNGFGKFKATFKASYEALFSIFFYKGMKILPSYPDARLRTTLKHSMDVLDSGAAVSMYPEDSGDGYHDELKRFFPGFVMLAEQYYKKNGEDVPVIPVYYSIKKKKIVVGKAVFLQDMFKEGLDRYQIAERCKELVNDIYRNHLKD